MNYAEIKTYLRSLVNRSDFTDDLLSQFIAQSQTRIERQLRTTAMEKFVEFTPGTDRFTVPGDMLEISDLWCNDQELERVDTSRYLRTLASVGTPEVFIQTGHSILMRPTPTTDAVMFMRYYASQPHLIDDTDTNIWSVSAIDALVYGAAELAGDFYEDERLSRYAEKFNVALMELKDQALAEDFAGPMAIQPAYRY